jgi:hypothetical protein
MLRRAVKVLSVFILAAEIVCAQTHQLTEAEALTAITLATNPSTKLAAAEEFINRFPKSSSRIKAAELVAAEILKVKTERLRSRLSNERSRSSRRKKNEKSSSRSRWKRMRPAIVRTMRSS